MDDEKRDEIETAALDLFHKRERRKMLAEMNTAGMSYEDRAKAAARLAIAEAEESEAYWVLSRAKSAFL